MRQPWSGSGAPPVSVGPGCRPTAKRGTLISLVLWALSAAVQAQFVYSVSQGAVTITGYNGPGGPVTIPATIDGLPVTAIGSSAFYQSSLVTSVVIPDPVTSIGLMAFQECSRLTRVVLPAALTRVEDYAFLRCGSLTNVTIPEGVTSIGFMAFQDCSRLARVSLPESLTMIGDSAFRHCSALLELTVPDTVTTLGATAFEGCLRLETLRLGAGLATLGAEVFSGCTNLASVVIPAGCTNIGAAAFQGCTGLVQAVLPDGLASIGSAAFAGCSGLTEVAIPSGVTRIGAEAFARCTNLRSATIPGSLALLDTSVFYGCLSLTSVVVQEGVVIMGDAVFHECPRLISVTLPGSLTFIGESAFEGCSALTGVAIPAGVSFLGNAVFAGCGALTGIYFAGDAPAADEATLSGNTATVYYPPDASGWSDPWLGRDAGTWNPADVIITGHREQFTTAAGTGARLHVCAVSGHPLHHQWYHEGLVIPGATNVVLTIDRTVLADAGRYSVTVANGVGGTSSASGQLTVVDEPAGDPVEDFGFRVAGGHHVEIQSYLGARTSVIVPNYIEGYPVTHIAAYAFNTRKAITNVILQDNLWIIGEGAFAECHALKRVEMGARVGFIVDYAFMWCYALESLYFSGDAPMLGFHVFSVGPPTAYYMEGTKGWEGPWVNRQQLPPPKVMLDARWIAVLRQPESHTILPARSVLLTVEAVSKYPLDYQWYKDAVPVAGATGPELTIASATLEDSGMYHVVVHNELGSTASEAAELLVAARVGDPDADFEFAGSMIYDYKGTNAVVTIPNFIGETLVTHIRERAFYGRANLTGVIIAGNLRGIGQYAFEACPIDTIRFLGRPPERVDDGGLGGRAYVFFEPGAPGWPPSGSSWQGTIAAAWAVEIQNQPADRMAARGEKAVFSVEVQPHVPGVGFQWYKDGQPLADGASAGPPPFRSGFTVSYYQLKDLMNSVDDAERFIADPSRWEAGGVYPVVENHGSVQFYDGRSTWNPILDDGLNTRPFPTQNFGDQRDSFVIVAEGGVVIPEPGSWTFGVRSDDGFRLNLTGHGSGFVSERQGRNSEGTLASFEVPTNGVYHLRLIYYENVGGAFVQLYAARGRHTAFSPEFHHVGDTAVGGLVVVPAFRGAHYVIEAADEADAGAYSVLVSNAAGSQMSNPALLTVTRPVLKVIADDQTAVYGEPAPANTVHFSGFLPGDDASLLGGALSFVCAYGAGSPVGAYAIRPAGLTSDTYLIEFVSGTLIVKAEPVITWTIPAVIPYGTPVSESLLNATCDVPGTFAYQHPGLGAVLWPGDYALTATFTPSDDAAYWAVAENLTLTVAPAPVVATLDDRMLTYGRPLTGFSFGAQGVLETNALTAQVFTIGGTNVTDIVGLPGVGVYDLGVLLFPDERYDVTVVPGVLTITPALPQVQLGNQTVYFDGQPVRLSETHGTTGAVVRGIGGGTTPTGAVTYAYYTSPACREEERVPEPAAAGVYYVRATVAAAGDYAMAVSAPAALAIVLAAPTIRTQPQSLTAVEGEVVTLGADAVGSQPMSYQWYKDNVALSGARERTYTVSGVRAEHTGSYRVLVSNSEGRVISEPARVEVLYALWRVEASRSFSVAEYSAGGTLEVNVVMDGDEETLSLYLEEALPEGWHFVEMVAAAGAAMLPEPGATGTLEFLWLDPPAFPCTLTYRVAAPEAASGSYSWDGRVHWRTRTSARESIADVGGSAVIGSTAEYHAADLDQDWRIAKSPEITRVISFFNAGAYHVDPTQQDGYAPGPGSQDGVYHASDYEPRDWKISKSPELTRLISFYNAGGYRVDPGQPDGYAPIGRSPIRRASGERLTATRSFVGGRYTPGTSLDVRIEIGGTAPALSLYLLERLPDGWVYQGLVDNPDVVLYPEPGAQGDIDFLWIEIPALPFTVTYRVAVPPGVEGAYPWSGELRWSTLDSGGEVTTVTGGAAVVSDIRLDAGTLEIRWEGGRPTFRIPDSLPAARYTIEYKDDPGTKFWAPLTGEGSGLGNSSVLILRDTTELPSARFYRLELRERP